MESLDKISNVAETIGTGDSVAVSTEAVGEAPAYHHDPEVSKLLHRLGLLGSPPEEEYDRFTRLASRIFKTPVALMSLLDRDRQYFKSIVGLTPDVTAKRETPLSHSFCQHVVGSGRPLIISDARTHGWVDSNLAIRDLGVIAYAGIPMTTMEGETVGSFCLIDTVPRVWTEAEIQLLTDLAKAVITQIEYRQRNQKLKDVMELVKRVPDSLDELGKGLHGLTQILAKSEDEYVRRFIMRVEDRVENLGVLEQEISRAFGHTAGDSVPQWVDLADMVQSTVTTVRALAPALDIALEVDPGPLWLNCDSTDLRQGLGRIVNEAAAYADQSVSITLRRFENEADVKIESEGRAMPAAALIKTLTEFSTLPCAVEDGCFRGFQTHVSGGGIAVEGGRVKGRCQQDGNTVVHIRLPLYDHPSSWHPSEAHLLN